MDVDVDVDVDVDSVEVIDLSGMGADRLVLDALAVFDVTEERDGGMATLDVLGDADDTVDLSGANPHPSPLANFVSSRVRFCGSADCYGTTRRADGSFQAVELHSWAVGGLRGSFFGLAGTGYPQVPLNALFDGSMGAAEAIDERMARNAFADFASEPTRWPTAGHPYPAREKRETWLRSRN